MSLTDALGQVVAELRLARGWTQAELAKRVTISQPTLSRLERGDGHLTVESLAELAGVFEMAPADLLRWAERALEKGG